MRTSQTLLAGLWMSAQLSASTVFSSSVWAGGLSLPIRGVRALSLGGAFVAGAEGPNALWYNPSRIDESSVAIEAAVVSLDASFTPSEGDQTGQTVRNQADLVPNPTIGIIWRVSDILSLGAGMYAPYSGFGNFSPNGPQRYSLIESDQTTLLYMHLGGALRLGRLRIGGGIQNVDARIDQRLMLSGYTGLFGTATDPSTDALEQVILRSHFNLTGNFGASYDAGPVTFGLALQLPYTISGAADFLVRMPSSAFFRDASVQGNKVHISVPFPLQARAGAAVRIVPRWGVELAVNYERWSVQKQIVLDPMGQVTIQGVPGIGHFFAQPMVIDRRMRDTVSLHLGSDVRVASDIHVRCGAFAENSAFGDQTFSVSALDDNKIGLAGGMLVRLDDFDLEFAASRVFQGTRTITDSQLRQLNPPNPSQTDIIGNGQYVSNYWVGGLGLSWHFDRS